MADGEDLIEKYAGSKEGGGGGKFEDKEKRDIARARNALVTLLAQEVVPSLGGAGVILDIGAGTGLLLSPLARQLVPQGTVVATDISSDFRAWMSARCIAEELANVQVRLSFYTAKYVWPSPSVTIP